MCTPIQPVGLMNTYKNHVIQPGESGYGIIWEIYEFEIIEYVKSHITIIPDVCTDVFIILNNHMDDFFIQRSVPSLCHVDLVNDKNKNNIFL